MRISARLLSGARWSLVLVAVGAILLIGFLPAHAQGDEEGTVSTPASQAPYLPLQVQPVNVNITQINPSKFPIIELYVLVTGQDGNTISGLSASNFLATEQSNLESQPTTETISVAPITATGNIAVALTIDRSGSMSGSEIADAKTAANTFVDNMATLDRAAIISFSASVTINQAFTSDKTALHNAVNSLSSGGGTAVYDTIYRAVEELTSEIGVKAVIIFTDGQSNSDSHSVQEAIDLAKDRGIPVYTIGLGSSVNESILQTIANETGGYYTFAPTAADLQQIYNDIAQAIRDQYLVTYSTHNPNYDGTTRTVEVTVTVGGNSDSDTETYTVTEPPEINLTQDTLNLMGQAQYAGQTLTIGAIITDDVAVTQAKLFYRTSGSGNIYKEVSMTSSSDLYAADIPGSDVAAPGVDFYITASDGTLTSSSPQNNPAAFPHQISILPNEAPVIGHTPVTTATVGTNVVISANVTDTTDYVDSVKLFYRRTGYVLYDSADMVSSSDTYVATIPGSKVTLAGIDYYILASDNHTVRTHDGTDVAPHHIDVTSGPINHPPDTKIETTDIDSANGTAKFTWSGSDDSTPPAQLVYKHRLLNPDSPLYDWLPEDEEWSSSTTATYPRTPDTCLPDGTYRFQVKAKDADGAIQPDSATYKFTIGLENRPPTASASNLSGQPKAMHPNTAYSVSAKYYDPNGREDLKYCYMRLNHPEKPLTLMWYQADGHAALWAGEEGENYLTIVDVEVREIADGNKGYELTWSFKINDTWPEVENAIDFGVFASDDGDLESNWEYDDTNASFSTEPALNCVVQLWPQGGPGSIGVVPECEEFDIYVGASTGDIGAVRFLGDASLNGSPDGDWTAWFDWNTDPVIGGWDASEKTKEWIFTTAGSKEVWVEIRNTSSTLTARCYKYINVTALIPSYGPYPYGYKFANAGVEGLTEQDKRVIFDETFDWSHILDSTYEDLLFLLYKDKIDTGAKCYGMVASSLMEYWDPDYDSVLEDQGLACEKEYLWYLDMPTVDGAWNGRNMQDKPTLKQILKFQLAQHGISPRSQYVEYYDNPLQMVRVLEQSTDYVIGVAYLQRIEGELKGPGHALAAYKIEETADVVKVYVYDPNSPDEDGDAKAGDVDDKAYDRYIEIDKSTNTWKYTFSPGWVWPAQDAIHSFLGLIPISAHNYYSWDNTPKPGGKLTPYPGQSYCSAEGNVDLLLADDRGRLTGVLDNDYLEEIPGVKSIIDIFGTPPGGAIWRQAYYTQNDISLTTTVTGTDEGTYSVTRFGADFFSSIFDIRTSEGTSDTFTFLDDGAELRFSDNELSRTYDLVLHRTLESGGQSFTATNIPTKAGTVHRYIVNWDILAQGKEGVTLQVDSDGDGAFEKTILVGSELDGEAISLVDQSPVSEASIIIGPNPVTNTGTTFFYTLPEGTSTAKLMIFSPSGRLLFETPLNVDSTRFPSAGAWNPVDQDGTPLANGPYVYVLIADGKVIGQGKMVIQR